MAALGRILQIVGFLWFAAAIAGEEFGLPPLNIFPAVVFFFLGRALRRQARRRPVETDDHSRPPEVPAEEPALDVRPLNTEREQTVPPPARRVDRTPEPDPSAEVREHNELLERLLGADEGSERPEPAAIPDLDVDRKPPMTSADMVAEARKRWDPKD